MGLEPDQGGEEGGLAGLPLHDLLRLPHLQLCLPLPYRAYSYAKKTVKKAVHTAKKKYKAAKSYVKKKVKKVVRYVKKKYKRGEELGEEEVQRGQAVREEEGSTRPRSGWPRSTSRSNAR